jgi:hypothetical protein
LQCHAEPFLLSGCKVTVEPLRIQIPCEYIGILQAQHEARQVFQVYLRLRSISADKKILISRQIYSSNLPAVPFACENSCNILYP